MLSAIVTVCGALLVAGSPQIQGDYIEARTADIYTGPCFSNAELFLTGDTAVVAWKITEGRFQDQDLKGLSIAAAVRGSTTFSKDDPARARCVLIVDANATEAQKDALIALAKELGGERFQNVAEVQTAPIQVTVEAMADHSSKSSEDDQHPALHPMPKAPRGSMNVFGVAEILTRPLEESDHACGNEVIEYPPLSKGVSAKPAYTLAHKFKGKALNTTWNDPNCRSSFVGHFAY